MGANSNIEWTHHTWNPWWGCAKVSAGCTNCYADTLATRYGYDVWGPKAERRFFGDAHWQDPLRWNRQAEAAGERKRVFCASMADVFERHMKPNIQSQMNIERARLWEVIEQTPMLDWLLLTKRPENIREMIPLRWLYEVPRNVWYGTSVEDQEQAKKRIPQLLQVPAVVRFLSCEPLLGPVDLTRCVEPSEDDWEEVNVLQDANEDGEPEEFVEECELEGDWINYGHNLVDNPEHREWREWRRRWAGYFALKRQLHWIIAGGESGPGARPMHPFWPRSLRDQCAAAGVAFFFKQHGEFVPEYRQGVPNIVLFPDGHISDDPRDVAAVIKPESGAVLMARVGKKKAGRLLDGLEWSEFPTVEVPA